MFDNVANEIALIAQLKIGKIVKYKPTYSGQCQELVDKVLDEADAEKGDEAHHVQKGDIITFAGRRSKFVVKAMALEQGKEQSSDEYPVAFSRLNHIAIVSEGPDRNGKISIIEQNVGNKRSVVESPLNTKRTVSYTKRFSSFTSFVDFKRAYTLLIQSEFTKEKAANVVNDPRTWKVIKPWFDPPVKYSFLVSISYTGSGTIKYYRPRKLQLMDDSSYL